MAGSSRAIPWLRSLWPRAKGPSSRLRIWTRLRLRSPGRECTYPFPATATPELVYNVDSSLVYKRLIAFQIRLGDTVASVTPRVATATS
jgi:hypothetical protein